MESGLKNPYENPVQKPLYILEAPLSLSEQYMCFCFPMPDDPVQKLRPKGGRRYTLDANLYRNCDHNPIVYATFVAKLVEAVRTVRVSSFREHVDCRK